MVTVGEPVVVPEYRDVGIERMTTPEPPVEVPVSESFVAPPPPPVFAVPPVVAWLLRAPLPPPPEPPEPPVLVELPTPV